MARVDRRPGHKNADRRRGRKTFDGICLHSGSFRQGGYLFKSVWRVWFTRSTPLTKNSVSVGTLLLQSPLVASQFDRPHFQSGSGCHPGLGIDPDVRAHLVGRLAPKIFAGAMTKGSFSWICGVGREIGIGAKPKILVKGVVS